MANKKILYVVKTDDNLTNISQKSGIPLSQLVNAKNMTNSNLIHPGYQFVSNNGVISYEKVSDFSNTPKNNVTNQKTPDIPEKLPTAQPTPPSQEVKSSSSQNKETNTTTESKSENEGSNSATKPCEVCDNENLQCLCEVIVTPSKSKDGSSETFYWKSRKEGRKAIPKVILAPGFSSKKVGNTVTIKGEETSVDYELIGCCSYGNDDRCVQAELMTLSAINEQYNYDRKKVPQEDSIDLTYDEDLKLYADISSHVIEIFPKEQNTTPENIFISAARFLLLNELKDYAVNYRTLSVAECDTKDGINKQKVVTHFVSLPLFEVDFDLSLSFVGEEVEEDVAKSFQAENLSPDGARYGKMSTNAKFEVKYNRVTTSLEQPVPALSTMPVMNQVTNVLHKLSSTKNTSVKSVPVVFNIRPPVIHIKAKASFAGGGQFVQREGSIELDPILGGEVKINLYELLAKIGGALGEAIRKGITDKFPEVSRTTKEDSKARKRILQGEKKSSTVRAAAFFYFGGTLDFKGEVDLVPSNIGDLKWPFENPKLGAEITLGLYAGVYAEARLWGFGGSFEAGIEIETSWEGYYYLNESGFKIWHNGIYVSVYVEASVGYEKSRNRKNRNKKSSYKKENPDTGGLNKTPPTELKTDWEGQLMDGGSEDNPVLDNTEPRTEKESKETTQSMQVNIKQWRNESEMADEEVRKYMMESQQKWRERQMSHLIDKQRRTIEDEELLKLSSIPNDLKILSKNNGLTEDEMALERLRNFLNDIDSD